VRADTGISAAVLPGAGGIFAAGGGMVMGTAWRSLGRALSFSSFSILFSRTFKASICRLSAARDSRMRWRSFFCDETRNQSTTSGMASNHVVTVIFTPRETD
jgi:hypothetical protein